MAEALSETNPNKNMLSYSAAPATPRNNIENVNSLTLKMRIS